MSNRICIYVSVAKTNAIVSVDFSEMIVKPVSCSNSRSCYSQGVIENGCPDVCGIVISAKRYMKRRRVKAVIDELNPDKL